jgi:hypothetical protein
VRDFHNGTTTVALVLAILGLATAAQAGPMMYSASLTLHSFANDATGALQALPLGAQCNPANGGTTCLTETIHKGAPLSGSGMVNFTGMAPFKMQFATGAISRATSGSLPPYPGISYTLTTANLINETGAFSAGEGPGSFSFVPALGAGQTHVSVVAGKNQFGGVMKLIGSFGTRTAFSTPGGKWKGIFPTGGVNVVGAKYAKTTNISGVISFTSLSLTYPSVAVVTGFPWTTGQVSVEAAGGYGFQTALVRSGYDNRTTMQGFGRIQLVAPRLTHWAGGAHWGDIAILNVRFIPEPKGWLMLVAGVGFLGAVHRARPNAR